VTLNVSTLVASAGPKDITVTKPDGQSATGVGRLAVGSDVVFADGLDG
jgi:hypothetical protein